MEESRKESTCMYKSGDYGPNLDKMRLSGEFCDVVIKTKTKEFPAHKVILAANLKNLKLICSNFNEDNEQSVFVSMDDVDETYLEAFIKFAYSGQMLLSESNVLGLLEMAITLKENGVTAGCTKFLTDHLKVENACQLYAIGNSIECLSLKNAARCIISSHFEYCSLTQEFFEFEFENMKHIFYETLLIFPATKHILLEGLTRWIMHDVLSRRNCIHDMLDIMEIDKINKEHLLEYVSNNIANQGFIVKDVMSFYNKKIEQSKNESQLNLVVIGDIDQKLHAQIWNWSEKKWSTPYPIIQSPKHDMNCKSGTVFDHTFYDLLIDNSSQKEVRIYIAEFNTSAKHYRMLISHTKLIRSSAMCSSPQFIYLCGGRTKDGFVSAQFLRYDPRKNCLDILPHMLTKRCGATSVFCKGHVYVLGGQDISSKLPNSVERYDPTTKEWLTLKALSTPYKDFGVAVLDDKIYIGDGRSLVVYDPSTERLKSLASMQKRRSKFHMVSHEGKLLVVGGDFAKTIEEYDPAKNQWKVNFDLSLKLQIKYPRGGILECNQRCKRIEEFEQVARQYKRSKLENQMN